VNQGLNFDESLIGFAELHFTLSAEAQSASSSNGQALADRNIDFARLRRPDSAARARVVGV
jgi:hypothetical protein